MSCYTCTVTDSVWNIVVILKPGFFSGRSICRSLKMASIDDLLTTLLLVCHCIDVTVFELLDLLIATLGLQTVLLPF